MGDEKKAKKLFQEGKNKVQLGKHDKAVETFLEALNYDSNSVEIWIGLSTAYSGLRDFEKVKEANKSALRINKKNHIPWVNLSVACFRLGEHNKAISAFREALQLKPKDPRLKREFEDLQKRIREIQFTSKPEVGKKKDKKKGKLDVKRGGDWKVEGNQSVFYFKIKVTNSTDYLIGNVQITLTSIPKGLEAQDHIYKIASMKPGSFESPTFKLQAKESCVGDTITAILTFTNKKGKQKTISVKPFEICYVCNLLSPKQITKEEFDEKIQTMERKQISIESDLDVSALESRLMEIVKNCNFALLQQLQNDQNDNMKIMQGFAEGLYDKQDVALSVVVNKVEHGSEVVVNALSDRAEKVTDLLRDFSTKLDDIKSDTELIKEYTSQIEDVIAKIDNLESFLMRKLGTDFNKIKHIWKKYKEGAIGKRELVTKGIKLVGKKFVKIFLGRF